RKRPICAGTSMARRMITPAAAGPVAAGPAIDRSAPGRVGSRSHTQGGIMRVSQGLAWLLVAGLSAPAFAGNKSTAPGPYKGWGDDDFDELEVVQTFKFADYTGVAIAPLDTTQVPLRSDNEAKNVQEAIATVDQPFLEGLKKGVSSFSKTPVQAGTGSGHVLLVKGKVITLDPGS